ncbi:MAG: Primosomal replication protein n [Nitrosomonadaceae bacterium]|nr:Primosomal replication protein n [Nitrosomonadaceae bacterium]
MTDFIISHTSRQVESDLPRQVECEVSAMAMSQMAITVSGMKIGTSVRLAGFLAKKSRMSMYLVLHVNKLDII